MKRPITETVNSPMDITPEFSLFGQSTSYGRGPTITVKRRRIAVIPPVGRDTAPTGDATPAPLPSRAAPKVHRLLAEAPTIQAELAYPQPVQRRQRRNPLQTAVVLRHEVFDTARTEAPQVGAGLKKFQDALQALAAIERDLGIVASCREFLASLPADPKR